MSNNRCIVALGANMRCGARGPVDTMIAASSQVAELAACEGCDKAQVHYSYLYESGPVPQSVQPVFYNAAMAFQTDKSASELLTALHAIEAQFGRARAQRWGPRVIDLDLIALGDAVVPSKQVWQSLHASEDESATLWGSPLLPHLRMHVRLFVLAPLRDIVPDWRHPLFGDTVEKLYNRVSENGDQWVRRLDGPQVAFPFTGACNSAIEPRN